MDFLRIAARIAAGPPPYHINDVKRRCRGLGVKLPRDIAPQADWSEPSWLYAGPGWLYTGPVNDQNKADLISKLEAKGLVVTPERVRVERWPSRENRDNNLYTFIHIDRDNTPPPVEKPRTEVD